jgi:hypothetical protein
MIRCLRLRPHRKNTLRAFVDLGLTGVGLVLRGCAWHVHPNGQEWIAFPAKQYATGTGGEDAEFLSRDKNWNEALDAIHAAETDKDDKNSAAASGLVTARPPVLLAPAEAQAPDESRLPFHDLRDKQANGAGCEGGHPSSATQARAGATDRPFRNHGLQLRRHPYRESGPRRLRRSCSIQEIDARADTTLR